MKSSESKGFATLIVFSVIGIVTLLSTAAAFADAYRLPPAFGDTVDELGIISESEVRLENTINHFIPLAGRYAVADGAYNLSTTNTVYTGAPDGDTDEVNVFEDMINEAEKQSQDYYENYLNDQQYDYCNVELDEQSRINVSYESSRVNVTSKNGNYMANVSCDKSGARIRTRTVPNKQIQFNTSDIRFQQVASIITQTLIEMEQVSESLKDNGELSGTATGSDCGSASVAETKAENEIDDQFNSIETAIVDSGHGFGGSDRGAMHRLDEATSTNLFCVGALCVPDPFHGAYNYDAYITDKETWRESVSASPSGNCGCCCSGPTCGCTGSCKTDYSVSQDYEYRSIEVQTNITDDKYTIPTKDGFTELFMNKKYERNFDIP